MLYVTVTQYAPSHHHTGRGEGSNLVEVGSQLYESTWVKIARAQDITSDERLLVLRLVEPDENGNYERIVPLDARRHEVYVMNNRGRTIALYKWARSQ